MLNMELYLRSLFALIGWDQATPPPPCRIWALVVTQDRRHLFATPLFWIKLVFLRRESLYDQIPLWCASVSGSSVMEQLHLVLRNLRSEKIRGLQRDVVYLGPIEPSYTYEPICGGGELQGLSQWVQLYTWSPNKLWRSNSIFNLWKNPWRWSGPDFPFWSGASYQKSKIFFRMTFVNSVSGLRERQPGHSCLWPDGIWTSACNPRPIQAPQ